MKNLINWMNDNLDVENYLEKLEPLLGPACPSMDERKIIGDRLSSSIVASERVNGDSNRRTRLVELFQPKLAVRAEFSDIDDLLHSLTSSEGGQRHASDILTAIYCEKMINGALKVLESIAKLFNVCDNVIRLGDCINHDSVQKALYLFQNASAQYLEATKIGHNAHRLASGFAELRNQSDAQCIKSLLA